MCRVGVYAYVRVCLRDEACRIYDHVPAVMTPFYPGEQGGTAVAQLLFGEYSPGVLNGGCSSIPKTAYSPCTNSGASAVQHLSGGVCV